MNTLYQGFTAIHVIGGALGLLTFWLPVVFRKGSANHKRSGSWFVWGMSAAATTGLLMTGWWLIDPMIRIERMDSVPADMERAVRNVRLFGGFLGLLSLLLITNLRHGVLVLRVREQRAQLRTLPHLLLLAGCAMAGIAAIATGTVRQFVLLQAFGAICVFAAGTNLHYALKEHLSNREWWIEHMVNLFAAGIAAHTAFFVFGGARLIGELFSGNWQMLPWLLPTALGVPASILVGRHYRRKFGLRAVAPAAVGAQGAG